MCHHCEYGSCPCPLFFMPRRPAVLLTPPHSIPDFSLFRAFCTPLQKSEAHPLPFQPLPASLQKRRTCLPPDRHRNSHFGIEPQEQSLPPCRFYVVHGSRNTLHGSRLSTSALFFALLHQSEAHPLPFQPFPHSLCVYPGWCHQERFSPSPVATSHSPLPAHKPFRMNTYKSVSKQRTLTTFRINTYTNPGGGTAPSSHHYFVNSLLRRTLDTSPGTLTRLQGRIGACLCAS
jgi:hypothetical protein